MAASRPGVANAGPDRIDPGDVDEGAVSLREALGMLRLALEPDSRRPGGSRRRPPASPRLRPGGLVLATDDGRGIARAVAADLKALGHPVLRVRHGVGSGEVEGLNLASAAAVAALLERARARGPLAAIVHASPLRDPATPGGPRIADGPDEARTLALLAQAGAGDLADSASRGGACLVVALPGSSAPAETERLSRWVEISSRTLPGVRVSPLLIDPDGEVEVQAAEIVRAVLAVSVGASPGDPGDPDAAPRLHRDDRPRSEAILLGAPDRAAWIHVAAALVDWLDDNPGARPIDLAATLHIGQPRYPFRVGLVAASSQELADRLRGAIRRLADPSCRLIHDRSGVYWTCPDRESPRPMRRSAPRAIDGRGRIRLSWAGSRPSFPPELADAGGPIPFPSGLDWLHHEVAYRYGRGEPVRPEILLTGRDPRKLDLSRPSDRPEDLSPVPVDAEDGETSALVDGLHLLDEVLDLQRRSAERVLDEVLGGGSPESGYV